MPRRMVPLANGQVYHIFNRGSNKQPIFLGIRDYKRAKELINFYSNAEDKIRYSKFLLLSQNERLILSTSIEKKQRLIENICYCFMPNHFHLLLRQVRDDGISKFMADFQNSYTRYFNTRHKRTGSLLQGQFNAVRIEDDNQLLHLSRYIHLNPYTSYIVKKFEELKRYPWSSLPEYLGITLSKVCQKDIVLIHFKNVKAYEKFVLDQALYQRDLDKIKHLSLE